MSETIDQPTDTTPMDLPSDSEPSRLALVEARLVKFLETWTSTILYLFLIIMAGAGTIISIPAAFSLLGYTIGAVQSFPVAPPEVFTAALTMLGIVVVLVAAWITMVILVTWVFINHID